MIKCKKSVSTLKTNSRFLEKIIRFLVTSSPISYTISGSDFSPEKAQQTTWAHKYCSLPANIKSPMQCDMSSPYSGFVFHQWKIISFTLATTFFSSTSFVYVLYPRNLPAKLSQLWGKIGKAKISFWGFLTLPRI